jgi:RNA polymerase-binding transcription factor DksA
MLSELDLSRFREKLVNRRKQILEFRDSLDTSWEELHAREVEFEETAQKQKAAQGLEQLDSREKEEIEAIDEALRKIDLGSYGFCESCGRAISPARLEAVPSTRSCKGCAATEIESPSSKDMRGSARPDFPPEYRALSNEQLLDAAYDHLRNDGRVDMEELDISCRNGVIYLNGALPSNESREILLDILENIMSLPDIVDNTQIERHLWERADRPPAGEKEGKTDEEVVMQGEDVEENVYESEQSGAHMSPPDAFIPEKEEE